VCEDEPIYIVTELMPGGSLLSLLRTTHKNKQDLSMDLLIDMAAQVSNARHTTVMVRAVASSGVQMISFLWSPYGIGQTIIFSSCGFFFLSFFFLLLFFLA